MYIKRKVSPGIILRFSWDYLLFFTLWAALAYYLYYYVGWRFIDIPIEPLTIIGIAVSFYNGFKNSQSYDRFWEARKIWGNIVNYSRSWANQVLHLVDDSPETHRRLIYRHLAYINALRIQLRQPTSFSMHGNRSVERLFRTHGVQEANFDDLQPFLEAAEAQNLESRKNRATHLVKNQGRELQSLEKAGKIKGFDKLILHGTLETLYNLQGKCERIKNTPFPRQYAYFTTIFCWIFVLLVPFGLIDVFSYDPEGPHAPDQRLFALQMIPYSVLIAWIFITMDRVGSNTEDPFEGRISDVPMTALCRTIEIDLRDMLDEEDLPEPVIPENNMLY